LIVKKILKGHNTVTESYIYLSDNYGRRSGIERRHITGSYKGQERRINSDRRGGLDRRITIGDRRSGIERRNRPNISYGMDRRSGEDRRGASYTLFGLDGI